jgi:hypothetical protein
MPVLYSQPFFAGSIVAGSGQVAITVSAKRTPQLLLGSGGV